ncbi:MAG TPA: hypothetical protein VHH88_11580 [Verrucomicrobiae bacterium]|nr:hypothetical protein [Verrucomicrobiae bacterium]
MAVKKPKAAGARVRDVLVILSNRLNVFQKPKFFELKADDQGTILSQRRLRSAPGKAVYDEVWENDEGRSDLESCNRFKRRYGHKLQKRK